MYGQLVAFLAVASVAFSSNCGSCYRGYGSYVSAEPGVVTGIGRGCYRSRILGSGWENPCELRATPIDLPATPLMASRSCSSSGIVSSGIVSSRILSSGIVSAPVEVRESPVLAVGSSGRIVGDICDSKAYVTPFFRENVGFPEVISCCNNCPVVVSSGLPVVRPQASIIAC